MTYRNEPQGSSEPTRQYPAYQAPERAFSRAQYQGEDYAGQSAYGDLTQGYSSERYSAGQETARLGYDAPAEQPSKYNNDQLYRDLAITGIILGVLVGCAVYITDLVVAMIHSAGTPNAVVTPGLAGPLITGVIAVIIFAAAAVIFRALDSASDIDRQYFWLVIALTTAVVLASAAGIGLFTGNFDRVSVIVAELCICAGVLSIPTRFAKAYQGA